MLINAMTTSFKPEKYHDTYTSALHEMIDEKVKGHQLAQPEERSKPTDVIDLMKYLKASIEKAGKADDKGKTTKAETSTDQQSSTATAPTRRRKKTANA
jgi:DNA end-binding protein Ku